MPKQGIIIVAYPGMGQEIYPDIYPNYKYLSMDDSRVKGHIKRSTNWVSHYVRMARNIVTVDGNDICFIDVNDDVIKYLIEYDYSFLIFYPGLEKESMLKRMALIYRKKPSAGRMVILADAILNYDKTIEGLRLYNNSIMSNGGVIREDLLTEIVSMDHETRINAIIAMSKMKELKKNSDIDLRNHHDDVLKKDKAH